MSISSKSGLVPTPSKHIYKTKKIKPETLLPAKYVAKPVTLTMRPFGALDNPYAKGCSVLCNHPAPTSVRNYIHQLKTSLNTESKMPHNRDQTGKSDLAETDNIPEDLFRRYTDTDSRPLTPSPTVTSVRTRNSTGSFLNNRRCITPELRKVEISNRKQIILDLRRSHSQETLYWKPTSEISHSAITDTEGPAVTEKKVKKEKSEDIRPKTPAVITEEVHEDTKKPSTSCINEHDIPDENVRRGKRRKKIKPQAATTMFHLSQDPETQVATLGPDSLNPSTRPSLIPNATLLLPDKEKRKSEPVLLKGSFLTGEAFDALKPKLDIDTIENTFEKYLNRAMREAIKYMPVKDNEKKVKDKYETEKLCFQTQLRMPRKFSKSATRFEVPLDMKELEKISVLEYLSKYVWVSRQRKTLYKGVFLKYLIEEEEPDPQDDNDVPTQQYNERKMSAKSLSLALADVLEFYGNEANIGEILRVVNVDATVDLNFRSWCGIVSFGERLILNERAAANDSADELEKADFTSMQQRLHLYKVPENLNEVFAIIRKGHTI